MQPMRCLKEDFSVLSVGRAVPPFCADSLHGGEFSLWFPTVVRRIQGAWGYCHSVGPTQQRTHERRSEKRLGFESTR